MGVSLNSNAGLLCCARNDRYAFTLAEVLITLGIIGVVAALTLPSLIQNHQKNVLKSQFKKQYANLQNSINKAVVENGSIYDCYLVRNKDNKIIQINSECKALSQKVLSFYNVMNACEAGQDCNPIKKGLYKPYTQVLAEGGFSPFASCNYPIESYNAYFISDGSIIYSYLASADQASSPYIVGFDVNGEKGPNKWGYDFFIMGVRKINDNLILTDRWCTLIEKGGYFPSTILNNSEENNMDFVSTWYEY